MASTGYIQVRAYESYAQIPLKDVAVSVTDTAGNALAFRLTNRSGLLDAPISVTVPDTDAGQTPNTGIIPFAIVNLNARLANYELITVQNLQIFPGIMTVQNLEMIPLSEYADDPNKQEQFDISPQNL